MPYLKRFVPVFHLFNQRRASVAEFFAFVVPASISLWTISCRTLYFSVSSLYFFVSFCEIQIMYQLSYLPWYISIYLLCIYNMSPIACICNVMLQCNVCACASCRSSCRMSSRVNNNNSKMNEPNFTSVRFHEAQQKRVNKITRGQTQENFLLTQGRCSEIPYFIFPRVFLYFVFLQPTLLCIQYALIFPTLF